MLGSWSTFETLVVQPGNQDEGAVCDDGWVPKLHRPSLSSPKRLLAGTLHPTLSMTPSDNELKKELSRPTSCLDPTPADCRRCKRSCSKSRAQRVANLGTYTQHCYNGFMFAESDC